LKHLGYTTQVIKIIIIVIVIEQPTDGDDENGDDETRDDDNNDSDYWNAYCRQTRKRVVALKSALSWPWLYLSIILFIQGDLRNCLGTETDFLVGEFHTQQRRMPIKTSTSTRKNH
jgi:hypothetical protein